MSTWNLPENKRAVKHEGDGDTSCNWSTWKNPQRLGQEAGRVRNQRTNRDQPNYSIAEVSQNTEKSPGDLRRPDVNQTPVKDR